MNNPFLAIVLLIFVSLSCKSNGENNIVVAKVYDTELHFSEFAYLFENKSYSQDDSTKIANEYINNWVEQQILIYQAKGNDKINLLEVEDKAVQYKNSLIIHKFENIYIAKEIDTAITENEIVIYYKDHQNDFQLNDYLVKVLYLKIPIDAPDINKIDRWYKLYNRKDSIEIDTYAKSYASNYYFDDENWMYFDDITKEIPLKNINKDKFITRKSKIRLDENNFYYFLNVIDYKLKNTVSPLEFEKENIKQRILNIRIKELREKFKKDNIQKAYDEKSVNIY